MKIPLVIDTDTASDDAVALILALRAKDVYVLAVTVVAGNVPVAQASRNARYTVELCGAAVPVYEGAARPLLREPHTAQFFHGQDGLGDQGYPEPSRAAAPGHAASVLVDLVPAHPGLTVVTLGPLTNVALARLHLEFDKKTAEFHTSANEDLRIFEDDLNCTTAHDIMLHEQGIIPAKEIKLILTALDGIRKKWRAGEVTIGSEYEDVHEYIETTVIKQIGIEAGGMIHTGRSRNDQVVTDIKLRLREDILTINEATLDAIEALYNRAIEYADTPMILYTHGQDAQVGTMGAYLCSHADILLRDSQRLAELYARVNTNPLGAGPVGGTSINIDRKRTTQGQDFTWRQTPQWNTVQNPDWLKWFVFRQLPTDNETIILWARDDLFPDAREPQP